MPYFLCSATLLAFLVELLKSSVAMQEQMLGGKGFLVIGYLLEKVSTNIFNATKMCLIIFKAFLYYKNLPYLTIKVTS